MERKKVILSAIQPSGALTLGNYIGALQNWVGMQDEYSCHYSVADLHAITVRQDPQDLRRRVRDTMALLLAVGLDPEKSTLFIQSHVSAHAELAWLLNCHTYMGELSRMTQFKEKSSRHSENINAGLFTYPVLMCADILLYQADLVPVGEDQRQHLEIARDIALRFNATYGETFTVPDAYIGKVGGRVMSLQEPDKKMSKSDSNDNAYIALLDPPQSIVRKVKRAVTDSQALVRYDECRPGVANLISILSACAKKSVAQIEAEFTGMGYGQLKNAVAEAIVAALEPLQRRFHEIQADTGYMDEVIRRGAQKAEVTAGATLRGAYSRVGLPLKVQP